MPEMRPQIEAILFDVGGTLRSSGQGTEIIRQEKIQQIMELVDASSTVEAFSELLISRAKAYRRWARENRAELNEIHLWTRWMLPDRPAARVTRMAMQLNQLWRDAKGRRELLPEAKDVLAQLFRRGYRLGIVSNTSSSVEVPALLRELEISGLFETVVLSCLAGTRKPHPAMLLDAAGRMGIEPSRCAYVGDKRDRDVVAARAAGFASAVLIDGSGPLEPLNDGPEDPLAPADHRVKNLQQVLDFFPQVDREELVQPAYDASFSTMWARHNFPHLSDFFEAAVRLGFARIELNHQVTSAMLEGVELSRKKISSIHEPCPANVSVEELKARDWLISSPNEERRQHGVQAIKRSIDLAAKLGVPVIVVHAGMVSTDSVLEQRLRNLFDSGRAASPEYCDVRAELVAIRRGLAPACLQSVRKSLRELLDYAGPVGIRLGLENRYHYYDIPGIDEMAELLSLADASQLGIVYDVGHAQNLDRLGFYAHEDWLRRYSSRIIEVHLHDVRGIHDHLAPGLGDVDFDMVARYLPAAAIRTVEVQPSNTFEQVKTGLQYLAAHACIKRLSLEASL